MIAEDYLGRSRMFRRLKNGSHGKLIEHYARVSLKSASFATAFGGASSWSAIS